jgi:fructose-1,6-bisphosphatase/inositol monophosphatase family enzyme
MAYERELAFAKALAKETGKMMRDAFGLQTASSWKEDDTPLTEADTAINRLVVQKVQQAFPDDGVLGEEESFETKRSRLWVVDPIDGTYSFTLGAPLSTFCLALVIDDQPVLGVVYDPYMRRMFWAQRGKGAFVNSVRVRVSGSKSMKHNYVILSSRAIKEGKSTGALFDQVEASGSKAFNFRSFAYSGCLVAAGSAVAAIIGRPKPWDVAAAIVIIEEAGGKVTDLSGKTRRYDDSDGMIFTNGFVHEHMLELVSQ